MSWPSVAIPTGPSLHRCPEPSRAGPPSMTSPSTGTTAPRPAPTAWPPDQPHRMGHVRRGPRPMPVAGPMHPQPRRQNPSVRPARRAVAPPGEPRVTRTGWPNTVNTGPWSNGPSPADSRQPKIALPRHHQERPLPASPSGRAQPTPADHPWPGLRRSRQGTGLACSTSISLAQDNAYQPTAAPYGKPAVEITRNSQQATYRRA
jgi:hypothetical protein